MAKEYRWADLAAEAEKDKSPLGIAVALLCRIQQAKPGGAAVIHRDEKHDDDHEHGKKHPAVGDVQHVTGRAEGTARK